MSKNKGNNNEKKNKKSMLLVGLSILFVIVIALVSIFWVKNTSKKDMMSTTKSNKTKNENQRFVV